MKTVYLAGPYSDDPKLNTERAILYGDKLLMLGFAPFIPHLCHFWEERFPHAYETWMAYCAAWIPKCDAVLVWGPSPMSPGTQRDVAVADEHKVPTFFSVHDLVETLSE